MIKSVVRFVVFCVAVLLVGQINVSGQTIGEHVETRARAAVTWTGNWVKQTKWAKQVGGDKVITEIMAEKKSVPSARPVEASMTRKRKAPKAFKESITNDDQKEIRRLLE